jgi:hypothetical protein
MRQLPCVARRSIKHLPTACASGSPKRHALHVADSENPRAHRSIALSASPNGNLGNYRHFLENRLLLKFVFAPVFVPSYCIERMSSLSDFGCRE